MEDYKRLLSNNQAWVEEKLALRSDYFSRMTAGQKPEYLWIGCADSRVPAELITGVEPGELFVHRNVANMVVHTDFNLLSVVQYAVEVLKVNHIIVCGHYGCGGIKTALTKQDLGLINQWLRHIKDVHRLHANELDAIANQDEKVSRLVELNVLEQARRVADLSFVQRTWASEQRPYVHGWVYDLGTGRINDLVKIDPGQTSHDLYEYEY
jgi:carbonic anhydrase